MKARLRFISLSLAQDSVRCVPYRENREGYRCQTGQHALYSPSWQWFLQSLLEDAEEEHSIDKEKSAEHADSLARRCESMSEQTAKSEQEREKDQAQ